MLELLLGQKKALECKGLLDRVATGRTQAVMTHFSLHAIEAVLNDADLNLKLLRNIENSLGMTLYDTSIDDEMSTAILMKEIGRDFDDTLQYYVAKKMGAEAIISFDRHFDGLDIPRIEPSRVFQE